MSEPRSVAEVRTQALFDERQRANWAHTDRLFGVLLVLQWVAMLVLAGTLSPRTWYGTADVVHPHIWAAAGLGGLIIVYPLFLVWRCPGQAVTRHSVAIAQTLTSALLIHITGGRIESHFHIFGSLAFLGFYRDWRVFVSATIVVAVDHAVRGILWPQSVYGVLTTSHWRWLEHVGWVAFTDTFVIQSCRRSVREMWKNASQQAELELAKERLEAEESRFRSLAETSPLGVYEVGSRGEILYVNERWCEIMGLARERAMDGGLLEAVHGDDRTRVAETLGGLATDARDGELEFRLARDDGEGWARTSWKVLRDVEGRLLGFVGATADVTQQKGEEAALEQARDGALEASRVKSEFLANMSHELRTPMNAVIGMAGLLEGTSLSREQHECVQTIRTSGDALLTIINDILDFSKIEAGQVELEQQPFCVRTAAEDSLELVSRIAGDKGLELVFDCDPAVPSVAIGDVTRLRQILVNLLSNAVKFTAEGEVVVGASLGRDGELLHFSVRDTGIGIPEDRMDRLFRSFSQVDSSTTRRYGGTGLGLAISRRFAELMGGEMWVESTPGEGSTFHFTMELRTHAPDGQATTDDFSDRRRPTVSLRGRRVLVLDDCAASREALVRTLVAWGLDVAGVERPADALERLEGATFDFLFVDMAMPEMTGLQFGQCLEDKGLAASAKKLLLTSVPLMGDGDPEVSRAARRFDAILTKPARLDGLAEALEQLVDGRLRTEPSRRATAPSVTLDGTLGRRAPLRILLAEDNQVNQKVALRLLAKMGYRADVAANGLEALEALDRQQYDVVLMDVQMPEMSGLEAAREIRARKGSMRQPVIVAMTANAMVEDRDECLAAGMDDFLAKPVAPQDLADAMIRAFGLRTGREAASGDAESLEPGGLPR